MLAHRELNTAAKKTALDRHSNASRQSDARNAELGNRAYTVVGPRVSKKLPTDVRQPHLAPCYTAASTVAEDVSIWDKSAM